jgi:hypothetical protein
MCTYSAYEKEREMKSKWHEIKEIPVVKKVMETGDHTMVEQDSLPIMPSEEDVEEAFKRIGLKPEDLDHWN